MCFNSLDVLAVLDEMSTGVHKKWYSLWEKDSTVQYLLVLSHIHSFACPFIRYLLTSYQLSILYIDLTLTYTTKEDLLIYTSQSQGQDRENEDFHNIPPLPGFGLFCPRTRHLATTLGRRRRSSEDLCA